MPKNYGPGVAVGTPRTGGLRSMVRLGRRELWMRLDRNMLGVVARGQNAAPRPGGSVRAH